MKEMTDETEEHISRLADMGKEFASFLELDKACQKKVAGLALLHDVGKTAVDTSIFRESGPLNSERRRKIRKHPEAGYQVARFTPEYYDIADAVLSHHEWWDGTGYPRGLSGEEIPLLARMFSLVEAYEVMTGKKARSPKEALEEIERMAGKQFDPQLAELFLQHRKEKR